MTGRKSLEWQIHSLPELDRHSLLEQYQRLHAKQPSPRLSRAQIELAVANQLQQQIITKLHSKMMRAVSAAESIISILITKC